MKKIETKNKHLTLEDRQEIEDCLSKRMSFKDIARLIGKDPTTVSYEIKHHRHPHTNSYSTASEPCPKLLKAPFVCNGCEKRSYQSCHFVRFMYRAVSAQQEYKNVLSETREGIPLNKQQFYENDRIISEGLKHGQHLYHILANSNIFCSKSTVYRHFKRNYYSVSVLSLPRAVKFKPRKQRKSEYVPKGIKTGRSYCDFVQFLEDRHLENHVELDTVIGSIGGKVILTIHFCSCNFMAGLLLDSKSAAEASAKFMNLKNKLRENFFSVYDTFGALLADNGGEFADVFSFENAPDGNREIRMFFCDPGTPSQKPQIEKNHTLFRDIVPSGSSLDNFTQDTVNLIFSHINAVSRANYRGKSAYDLFSFLYSPKLAALFGISYIPPDKVIQSPLLIKNLPDLNK